MTKVAILQSAYIPWRGYFDLIGYVDKFILYDEVQFTHSDWRNRNMIRTQSGTTWLTIPVSKKHRIRQKISDTTALNGDWRADHLNRISQNYYKSPFLYETLRLLEPIYRQDEVRISHINHAFLLHICAYLGIATEISWSRDYGSAGGKSERLVSICRAANADTYVSGPAARDYLDTTLFADAGINVEWFSYAAMMPYEQIHGGFEGGVSIVDLLSNVGPRSAEYLPSTKLSLR